MRAFFPFDIPLYEGNNGNWKGRYRENILPNLHALLSNGERTNFIRFRLRIFARPSSVNFIINYLNAFDSSLFSPTDFPSPHYHHLCYRSLLRNKRGSTRYFSREKLALPFLLFSFHSRYSNKYQGLKITRVYDRDTAFLTIEDVDTDGDVIGRMTRSRTG